MNEQAGLDDFGFYGFDDFVEGKYDGFKVWLVKLQGKVGRGLQPWDADAQTLQVCGPHGAGRNHDGAVAFAKAGTAIEQNIFVSQRGISRKADCGDVVGFGEGRLVERLNVREDVSELIARRGELVGRKRIEHKRVIGIGRVG